jgi:hypothetical protein
MSYPERQQNSCATCGKSAGIFTCRGCTENFCLRHTNEHREFLDQQMNDIIINHNQFQQTITGQTTEQFRLSLMQQIDQWEQKSIDKIHQVSNDIRQQLLTAVRDRTDNLKENLTQLSQQLDNAHRTGEYFENDLKEWAEKLNEFQQIFIEQQKIQVHHDKNSTPFISRISLSVASTNSLTHPIHDIRYESNHHDVINDQFEDYSHIEEKAEFSSGEHTLRFKIEQYKSNSFILFGIISKMTSEVNNSYENPTFYGWTGNSLVYLAGNARTNYKGYRSDIQAGDTLILTLDCDREIISLTNERTHRTYDLEVDIAKCPLPWQPNVRFYVSSK